MSETILFDPSTTRVEIRDRILPAGNYTGTVDSFELCDPLENGQQYKVVFRAGDGTSTLRNWMGHSNPEATEIGHKFLVRLFHAIGITERLTLTNGNKLLAGKPVAFGVRGTGQYEVSKRTNKQYERTEVKYIAADKDGLPAFDEMPVFDEKLTTGASAPW